MTPTKSRPQWADEIRVQHGRAVESFLELGRTLIAAKKALAHGEFQKMIAGDLPFDASTAQRLMKIAKDPRLANAAHAQLLPSAWGTAYELTKLPNNAFEKAAASGAINPKMTRKDAKRIKAEVTQEGQTFKAPGRNAVMQGETKTIVPRAPMTIEHDEPVADVAPLGLKNLAKAADAYVAAIASAIEQGGRPDLIAGCDEALRRRVRELLTKVPMMSH